MSVARWYNYYYLFVKYIIIFLIVIFLEVILFFKSSLVKDRNVVILVLVTID